MWPMRWWAPLHAVQKRFRSDPTKVIAASYFSARIERRVPTLDLMVSLEEKIGHRIGLDAVASATCGIKKTASGIESIQWWRDGKQQQVAEYCCYDVKATRLVHEHGVKTGQVSYMSFKTKLKQSAKVDWASIGPVGHLLPKTVPAAG